MTHNLDLRALAKGKGVFLYEVATELNVSEPTLMRWLRADLDTERRAAIVEAINRIAEQHTEQRVTVITA